MRFDFAPSSFWQIVRTTCAGAYAVARNLGRNPKVDTIA
jgi:hypothetical protein